MWCHGAPGIGMSRLALLDVDSDPAFAGEIEAAVEATIRHGIRSADHLCCGNFGRIDFLVEAARRLGRTDLHGLAVAAAKARLDRCRQAGSFPLSSDDAPEWLKPSLFRGTAGVGYALLRLAAPDEVPTVLTWN
jgi:lantibiotic modifying enzyme